MLRCSALTLEPAETRRTSAACSSTSSYQKTRRGLAMREISENVMAAQRQGFAAAVLGGLHSLPGAVVVIIAARLVRDSHQPL